MMPAAAPMSSQLHFSLPSDNMHCLYARAR
jgi:hypothetical protein